MDTTNKSRRLSRSEAIALYQFMRDKVTKGDDGFAVYCEISPGGPRWTDELIRAAFSAEHPDAPPIALRSVENMRQDEWGLLRPARVRQPHPDLIDTQAVKDLRDEVAALRAEVERLRTIVVRLDQPAPRLAMVAGD